MDFELPILAPSILAADYTKLGEEIRDSIEGGARWIHCDIMDGHFVPNISYGPALVAAAGRSTDQFLDVHLMIENPDRYVEDFVDAGADQISVHVEACPHLHRSIQNIRQFGIMAGVAVNPGTSLYNIEPVLEYIDLVLIMSVNPGFGGQDFIESTYERLRYMADIREKGQFNYLIEVDGGVGLDNIEAVTRAGADVLVAGSSVFKAKNIPARVGKLIKKARLGSRNLA